MDKESYKRYLRTPHWRKTRKRKIKQVGYKCQNCGSTKGPLEAHHKTYKRIGKEKMRDLKVLCHACHRNVHKGPMGRLRNIVRKVRGQ